MTQKNGKTKIAIVGLGLIGGSLALALKERYYVIGCSKNPQTEQYALKCGMVDEIRPISKLKGVDSVIVCTPLSVLKETVRKVYAVVGDSAVITDVGSVKGLLKGEKGRIVGGHPMAGTENSGIAAAKPHLFENAYYCIVPYENSAPADVEFVTRIAAAVKAKPVALSAEEHDLLAAKYSHMPHMCAYALSESVIGGNLSIAGSGFMDSTRIACSDPEFWTEVFRLNRLNTLTVLDSFMSALGDMRDKLESEDYAGLRERIIRARDKRVELSAARNIESDYALTADVKDEVGSIGAVTALLVRGGVSIKNMNILNSREGVGGALRLEFASLHDSQIARRILSDAGYSVN